VGPVGICNPHEVVLLLQLTVPWDPTGKPQQLYRNWQAIAVFLLFILYQAWWWI